MTQQENGENERKHAIRPYLTREKAIEILEDIVTNGRGLSGDDRIDAIKLGISALREVIAYPRRLPGI